MIVKASAKGVRMSPRKIGVVAALVRGRSVEDAITILEHTPRRASLPVKKVIESAKANAANNHNLQQTSLKLSSITVTPGSRMKRFRPAAHGRALPYEKKSSHIFVSIEGEPKPAKKPAVKKEKETK
jgi:large subunit ribosomal protein L22